MRRLSRREAMTTAGTVSLASFLAACDGGGDDRQHGRCHAHQAPDVAGLLCSKPQQDAIEHVTSDAGPDARGGGTGAALVEHVRSWAERAGCDRVYWLTQKSNHTARKLYDRVAHDTGFVHYEIDISASDPGAS